MKIFRNINTYVNSSVRDGSAVSLYDHRRAEICRFGNDNEPSYILEGGSIFTRLISVNGVIYKLNGNVDLFDGDLLDKFISGTLILETESGSKSELLPEIQYRLWIRSEFQTGNYFFQTRRITRKVSELIVVDLANNEIRSIEVDKGFVSYFEELCVLSDNIGGNFTCCDSKPRLIWKFSLEMSLLTRNHGKYDPVSSHRNLIFNHGATKSERLKIQDDYSHSDNNYYFDSLMACYHIDTGEKRWEYWFDEEVNDYLIVADRLYVATNNKLHVIHASTGQLIVTIDTMYSRVFNPEFNKNHLVIINNKLLFTHGHDRKINIYDTDSLNLDRVIELPSPWRVNITGESFYHEPTDRLYIRLESSNNERERYAYLQVDPNRLDAMVELEKAPEFHIDIVEKGAHKEVLLECSDQNFSDVMRYLDIHARNAAYEHGVSITKRFDCTAGFNGNILFNYHYKGDDVADAQEKLDTICKRFNEDADVYSLLAADRSKNCQLVGKVMPAES